MRAPTRTSFLACLVVAMSLILGAALPAAAFGAFTDDDGNPHEPAIEIIAAAGITRGCNAPVNDHYCPSASVTRGEMAAFLNRTFGFSATQLDAFNDDEGSSFEADINAIAAAGVTTGCATNKFCPQELVTRGQMAAFLVRALGLPTGGTTDTFNDDDGTYELFIEALAQAGITTGCTAASFCPQQVVRRDEMASFLARSIAFAASSGCTMVIGFSQTEQWYEGGFEQIMPSVAWQLLAESGGSIERWADPAYIGWTEPIDSKCLASSPNRIVLTITGENRELARWISDIEAAITVTKSKYPSAEVLILQPVVGGPDEALCPADTGSVRASENHPVIDQAIAQVVAGRSDVVAGASPEVRSCADYSDNIGHLVESARGSIGGAIAAFYLSFD